MGRIIAVANVKGGVGKTTTTGNLVAALAERGRKVLAVDLDPQASLTVALGFSSHSDGKTIRDALSASATPVRALIVPTRAKFDLVPGSHALHQVERELENAGPRIYAVRDALAPLRGQYDYIMIDCPANAGILTGNALAASDEVVIPFPADYLSLQALDWFLEIIHQMQYKIAPNLHVAGLFLAMYDPRLSLTREMITMAQKKYGIEIPFFSATVSPSDAIKQATRAGQSIFEFAPNSRTADAYRTLAREIEEGIRDTSAEDAYAALRQGRAALAQQDLSHAYNYFCQATKLDSQIVDGWLGRAQSASEWDEVARCLAQALTLQPENPEAREGLENQLRQTVQSSYTKDIPKLMAVAHYLNESNFRAYAEMLFRRVTESDETREEAWLGRARTTSNIEESILCFERAQALNPSNAETQSELAAAQLRLKSKASMLVEKAQALMRDGTTEQAHALFQQATRMDPNNDHAWVGCARTSANFEEAFGFVKHALEINPLNAEAHELYTWLWKPGQGKDEPENGNGWPKESRPSFFGFVRQTLSKLTR